MPARRAFIALLGLLGFCSVALGGTPASLLEAVATANHGDFSEQDYAMLIPRSTGTVTGIGACGGWNTLGYADGCAGAPPAGPYAVEFPNFLSSTAGSGPGVARQTGQPAYANVGTNTGCINSNCHPPWAMPGVDYWVGPSCGSACGFGVPGSATDPTNSSSPNWGTGNPGGCTSGGGAQPVISCKGTVITNFTGATVSAGTITATSISGATPYVNEIIGCSGSCSPAVPFGTVITGGSGLVWTTNQPTYNLGASSSLTGTGMATGTLSIGPFDWSYAGSVAPASYGTIFAPVINISTSIAVPCIIHDNYFAFDNQKPGYVGSATPTTSVAYNINGCTSVEFDNNKFAVLDAGTHAPTQWSYNATGTLTNVTISGTTLFGTCATGSPAAGQSVIGPGIVGGTTLQAGGSCGTGQWPILISQNLSTPTTATTYLFSGVSYYLNIGQSPVLTSNRPMTFKYNAFMDCPVRCIVGSGDFLFEYNYLDGFEQYDSTVNPAHGDGMFTAFDNANLPGGTGLNYYDVYNNTWLMKANMNTGLGPYTSTAGATCMFCPNIIVPDSNGVANIQNGSSSMTVLSVTPGTVLTNQGISLSRQIRLGVGSGLYQFGGLNPAQPVGLSPTFTACPATPGCGAAVNQVAFSGSASGTTLTTDSTTTLQTNEFVSPTGTSGGTGAGFNSALIDASGNLTAASAFGTPVVGMTITGGSVPAGTYLVSGSGTSWVTTDTTHAITSAETMWGTGPSPSTPYVVAGGTGTTFTLSTAFSPGTVLDGPMLGQNGLGTYTLSSPWISASSGPFAVGFFPQATYTSLDYERNVLIANMISSASPSWGSGVTFNGASVASGVMTASSVSTTSGGVTGPAVGQVVTGPGIPANITIASINAGPTWTLSDLTINVTGPETIYSTPTYTVSTMVNGIDTTNYTVKNNYFDTCGALLGTLAQCTNPITTGTAKSYGSGNVSTSGAFIDESNIRMNSGECLHLQGSAPASCAPVFP